MLHKVQYSAYDINYDVVNTLSNNDTVMNNINTVYHCENKHKQKTDESII